MKKIILFTVILLLVINTSLIGQITIAQADMPNANDSVRVSFSSSSIDPTLTGVGYTWNYSSLVPDAQTVQVFDPPSSFVFPYNAVFNSFNTSYGVEAYAPDSIGGIQPDDAYNYYRESASSFNQVGMGITVNSIPFPILFDQPDYIYRFPMNYGNIDSSDAYYDFTFPGFGTYGQFIHRVNEVDGWGQLTTPLGTVASLRVKSIINVRDTIKQEADSTGYSYNRPPRYEYKWLSVNGKIPYLEVGATDFGGGPTVTNIIYQDIYQPGVFQIGIEANYTNLKIVVYPNPASDIIYIKYELAKSTDIYVEIIDVTGKTIISVTYPNQLAGSILQAIYLGGKFIAPGTYLLKISGSEFSSLHRILIK